MYAYRKTKYGFNNVRVKYDIHKNVKIDSYTYEAIMNCKGKNFSDKLRTLVADYVYLQDNLGEK